MALGAPEQDEEEERFVEDVRKKEVKSGTSQHVSVLAKGLWV